MKHLFPLLAIPFASLAFADGPPGPPSPSPQTCVARGGTLAANEIVGGDFGTGSGTPGESAPAPGLGALTTYTYSSWTQGDVGHPTDGEYTIVDGTGDVRPFNTWHSQLLGHTTGLADDRFAVFNASVDSGTFYTQTLSVTPNTNFEVSFWQMNINRNPDDLLLPNLAIVVRRIGVDPPGGGLVVATSGDVPEQTVPFWQQYAAVLNSGAASQLEVRLDNNAAGGLGNDFALDDLVLAPCSLPSGTVTGTLYYDVNLDSTYEAAEPGLPANIPVELVDTGGTPDPADDVIVATVFSAADGSYAFANVPVGANDVVRAMVDDAGVPANVALHTANDVPVQVVAGGQAFADFGFASADVRIVKRGPAHVSGGAPVTYALTISNPGPTAADGATYDDPVPAALSGVTASCGGESGGAACGAVTVNGNDVAGTVARLPVGGSVVVTVTGTSPAEETTLTNTATVTPAATIPDPDTGNNSSTASTTTPVDLMSFGID